MKKKVQPSKRAVRGEKIARLIAPDAWAEYDRGNGHFTNSDMWEIRRSFAAADRILNFLDNEK